MKALKALVIFMGILIAIGVTVVGVTIYRRATDMVTSDKATSDRANPAASSATTAPRRFGSRPLDVPPGSMIASVQPVLIAPGVERVLVHVDLPDGGARILVLDPLSGEVSGEWLLKGTGAKAGGSAPP
jgi:hypothetical protein